MNRRGFLENLGFAGAAIVTAPFLGFAAPAKRTVYKVTQPAFLLLRSNKGLNVHGSTFKTVCTYHLSLKELCDRHPNDDIFYYPNWGAEPPKDIKNWVRARVVPKEPGVEIVPYEEYYSPETI